MNKLTIEEIQAMIDSEVAGKSYSGCLFMMRQLADTMRQLENAHRDIQILMEAMQRHKEKTGDDVVIFEGNIKNYPGKHTHVDRRHSYTSPEAYEAIRNGTFWTDPNSSKTRDDK